VIEQARTWNWDRKGGRNLFYKPSQQNKEHEHQCKEMEKYLWRHLVSTASAIYEVKPEQSRLKHYGNPWRICRVIQICAVSNLIADEGIQIGEVYILGWLFVLVKHAIWADSLYFLSAVTFDFQNPNIIPTYCIGMLGYFWFFKKTLLEIVPVFMEPRG
jgi:hypothetical protein